MVSKAAERQKKGDQLVEM